MRVSGNARVPRCMTVIEKHTGEIECHTKRRAKLIIPSVAFSDGRIRVVNTREHAGPAKLGSCAARMQLAQ